MPQTPTRTLFLLLEVKHKLVKENVDWIQLATGHDPLAICFVKA